MVFKKQLLGLFVASTLSVSMVYAESISLEIGVEGDISVEESLNEVPSNFELYEEHFNAGKLSERGYLYEGKPVGEWQRWHENGELSVEALFTTEGKQAGTWIYYNDAGKKIKEEVYEEGELINTREFE